MTSLENRAADVRLLALDVDGVLTDGRIYYSNTGDELKAFNIKDGLGALGLEKSSVQKFGESKNNEFLKFKYVFLGFILLSVEPPKWYTFDAPT